MTDTAEDARRSRALILSTFLRPRIADEIRHEAHHYHHDGCAATLGFTDCQCDGPARTREQLEAFAAIVELVGSTPNPCQVALAALEKVGDVYAHHTNYPRISDPDHDAELQRQLLLCRAVDVF